VSVERIILYGSHQRGAAHEDSDIDVAVFSEAFGSPNYLEFSGVLSQATWTTEPMIEAIGFHPLVLENVNPISFLHEIVSTGEVVYRRTANSPERQALTH
jgi:predicted nucleotidyltransferase